MDTFFNTINLKEDQLSFHFLKAEKQTDRVLAILKQRKIPMTPFGVHEVYVRYYGDCLITSIRRAISTLTAQDKLIKTRLMKDEVYGKPNYKWIINGSC